MLGDDGEARRAQARRDALRGGDRAVLAAGAADGDGDIGLELVDVARQGRRQQVGVAVDEGGGAVLAEDVVGHGRVLPRQVAQLGHPVGVGDEADVEDLVGVHGQAVLEAEGHDEQTGLYKRLWNMQYQTDKWKI